MTTTNQTVTVTDSAGNTYVDAVSQSNQSDNHQLHLFYAANIAAGPTTVTATFSGSNNHPWLAIHAFSGLRTLNPLDKVASAQGSSTTPMTPSTMTTSTARELVVAGVGLQFMDTATLTVGSGYTLLLQDTQTSRAMTEYKTVSATGAYQGTFGLSSSSSWTAVVATFQ